MKDLHSDNRSSKFAKYEKLGRLTIAPDFSFKQEQDCDASPYRLRSHSGRIYEYFILHDSEPMTFDEQVQERTFIRGSYEFFRM